MDRKFFWNPDIARFAAEDFTPAITQFSPLTEPMLRESRDRLERMAVAAIGRRDAA